MQSKIKGRMTLRAYPPVFPSKNIMIARFSMMTSLSQPTVSPSVSPSLRAAPSTAAAPPERRRD